MYPTRLFALPFVLAAWPILITLMLFDVLLKGFALWRAGKNNQSYWFIALFLINSLGILPAIYLLFFQPKGRRRARNS